MDFLADVWVHVPRLRGAADSIARPCNARFKGKSIGEVLEMDVQEALEHFANVPKIANMLQTLHDVGLDYLKLGQPSPTLSGGEAQRIKLAKRAGEAEGTGRTLYVLDEPTTGLHFEDVRKLLEACWHGFADAGNTVVVIEHNLDVIKTADWLDRPRPRRRGRRAGDRRRRGHPRSSVGKGRRQPHRPQALARICLREHSKSHADHRRRKSKTKAAKLAEGRRRRRSPTSAPISSARRPGSTIFKGVDVDIPRHKMTVCSGPSGSGKSSFAIDTLYAEGQRRYVESLSSYARQFLAPLPKPKRREDHRSEPLPSASSRRPPARVPRSTVGTVTEIHDYLRILFARLGHPHCPEVRLGRSAPRPPTRSSRRFFRRSATSSKSLPSWHPVARREGEDYQASLGRASKGSGFARVRVDGK